MSYRLITCDLDETLLDRNHQVGLKNRKAIKRAREEYGIQFVPTTGRGFPSVQKTLKELAVDDLAEEYVISFNGGAITENKGNRLLDFTELDFDKMAEIFAFGLTQDVCIHVQTLTDVYLFQLSPSEKTRLDQAQIKYLAPQENSVEFLRGTKIAKILFQHTEITYLKNLAPQLASITDEAVEVSYSSNRYMEFNPLGVNKGAAVKKLAAQLGIPLEEVIAVGDNYNDLTMLEVAGLAVVAQNGVEEAKAVADYITTVDHHEGVVAELLDRFIFNA